jgi:hypothetical protein
MITFKEFLDGETKDKEIPEDNKVPEPIKSEESEE